MKSDCEFCRLINRRFLPDSSLKRPADEPLPFESDPKKLRFELEGEAYNSLLLA